MLTEHQTPPAGADGGSLAAIPLRIAVATADGVHIDRHFGQAETFTVYDVTAGGALLVERRVVSEAALSPEEDRRDIICRMISDCRCLLVAKIGVAPQERLAGLGIEASDMHAGAEVTAALRTLHDAKMAPPSTAPVDAAGFRLAHVMLRVSDLDRALDFYTRLLGMTVIETREHKKNQFTQVYLGYGEQSEQIALELVFNWMDDEPLVSGSAFGHVAIEVSGITALCNRLASEGVAMPRPPRAQRHGDSIVAFIEDPDGHRIELVQPAAAA